MIVKDKIEKFIYQINTLIQKSDLYSKYSKSILEGKNDFKISQIFTKKNYDIEWIEKIEECVNALDTIVRNPRRFIVVEEDIVDVSLARSVTIESVKHLAQHTNFINSVKKDGSVIPSKILNTSKEESFEIYENRFIYTLLLKIKDFINIRFEEMKKALLESSEIEVDITSDFNIEGNKISYGMKSEAHIPFDEIIKPKSSASQASTIEKVIRIKNIIDDFLSSAFAREMRGCALVRPPITRTNVILKDPNFKKALVLWQYIVSQEKAEFKVETIKETAEMPPQLNEKYRGLILWNTALMQSIAAARDEGDTYEKTMEKDKEIADEYVSKDIDDFAPEDFPDLKLEISEIRRIYHNVPIEKPVTVIERRKVNAAIDRVIRQYKINKAKEDSKMQRRLIAQQIKEEEKARQLALKEKIEEERRLKKQQELEEKEKRKRIREQLAAERKAEQERIAFEKKLALQQKKEEEERRLASQKQIEEEKERIRQEKERELERKLFEEKLLAEQRLKEEALKIYESVKKQREEYWALEKEFSIRLLTEEMELELTKQQKEALEKIKQQEALKLETLRNLQTILENTIYLEYSADIQKIVEDARTFRSNEEIVSIARDVADNKPSFAKLEAQKRLEILKTQLEIIKKKRREKKNK